MMPLDEDDFQACLHFTLGAEGGFVNDGADPGGPTNFGITIGLLQFTRPRARVTAADVHALTLAEATNIYRSWFWQKPNVPLLPRGVDLIVFDFGVNAAPFKSVIQLQRVVGAETDGILGPLTAEAVASRDPLDVIEELAVTHAAYYRARPTFPTFGDGWLARVEHSRTAAHARATESATQEVQT